MRFRALFISIIACSLPASVLAQQRTTVGPVIFRSPPVAFNIPLSGTVTAGADMTKLIGSCVLEVEQRVPSAPETWHDEFIVCMAAASDSHVVVLTDTTNPKAPAPVASTVCEQHVVAGVTTCVTPSLDWRNVVAAGSAPPLASSASSGP